jgi:hypothetical protein
VSEFFATNAPDPPHLNPYSCFGAFWTVSLLQVLRCKTRWTGAINALVRATRSRQNFSQRTHPIHPIGPETHDLWRFGPFRYCMNLDAKWAELLQLMHKFVQRSRVRIFCIERTRSTLLHSNSYFGAFWIVSILHELRCKTSRIGAIKALVRAMKSRWNFSQRTHPIHLIALKLMFWGISDRFDTAWTSVQNRLNWCD